MLYVADAPADLSGLSVNDNNITGNWYSEVNFKGANALSPLANFECNWYGTDAPTVGATNTAEAGYGLGGIIPQQLSGTYPGTRTHVIRGERAADIDYVSWRTDNTGNNTDPFVPTPSAGCNGTPIELATSNVTPVSCFAGTDGTITVTLTGGTNTVPTWTGPGINVGNAHSSTLTGLVAGTYTLTATDDNGSSFGPQTFTVTEPAAALSASIASVPALCEAGDVNFDLTVTGGTLGYGYSWSGPDGFASTSEDPSITGILRAADGTYTVLVTDANSCTTTASVTVDVQYAPSFSSCPAPAPASAALNTCAATVSYAAPTVDADPSATLSYTLSGATTGTGAGTGSGLSFPVGTTTVTLTATNGCGSSSTCSFDVVVTDDQDPTVGCPANVTTSTALNSCTAIVNSIAPVGASDNCSFAVTYTLSGATTGSGNNDASGNIFNLGTTTVAYLVTDASGNTDQCSFTVTVQDNQSPSVACPLAVVNISTDAGQCTKTLGAGITPAILPSINDNCDPNVTIRYAVDGPVSGASPALNPATFTQAFAPGAHTINYLISDTHNNTTTCSVNVSVVDGQAPTVNCPAPVTAQTPSGSCTAVVSGIAPTVNENCAHTVTYTLSGATTASGSNDASGSTFNLGTTTVTYTVTETNTPNRVVTCSFNVTVEDVLPPSITCPADISANTDLGSCSATVTGGLTPTFSDACGGTLSYVVSGATTGTGTGNLASFSFNQGTSTVTWTATDISNNSTSCSFTVIVTDDEAPEVTCPADISVTSTPALCGTTVNWTEPTYTDNCTGSTLAQIAGPANGSFFAVGTTTITYVATDAAGLTDTCSFTVTVTDSQSPTINNCAPNATVPVSAGLCTADVIVPIPSFSDNCAGSTVNWSSTGATVASGTGAADGTYNVGTTIVTFTVTDGVFAPTCTTEITVIDNISPSVACPGNLTFNTDSLCFATPDIAPVGAVDNCGMPTIDHSFNGGPWVAGPVVGGPFPLGTTNVTFRAMDVSGNASTCNFTVTAVDNSAPVIACTTPAPIPTDAGQCSATVALSSLAPTVTENCAYQLMYTLDGDQYSYDENAELVLNKGGHSITWTVTEMNAPFASDDCTIVVNVVDQEAPVASLPTLPNVSGECSATATAPTATDNCAGLVTGTTTDPLTYTAQGTYTITWTYQDADGNSSQQTQTVVVDDVTAPVADVASLPTITGECSATATAPTATDNCVGSVTGTTTDPLSYSVQGTYTITWTYDDGNGNTSTQDQTVIVDDVTAPVADVASLPTLTGECSATATAPTATDNCVGPVIGTTTDHLTYNVQGTYTITWTYDDGNGNTSQQTQTVVVDDFTAPLADVASLPTITGECNATATAPTATDNCVGSVTGTTTDPLTYSVQGTYTITWTYDDGNGNTSAQTQTVVVDDVTAPVADVASLPTITGECSATATAPTATDNCVGPVTGTTTDPLTYNVQGTYTITWTYDDGNGNSSSQTQTVVVDDNTQPTAVCQNLTVNLDATGHATITAAQVNNGSSDNCTAPGALGLGLNTTNFTCANLGTNSVTLTVTDAAGNASTCTATVTVVDNLAPVVAQAPGFLDRSVACNDLPGFFAAQALAPTATDNCGTANISLPTTSTVPTPGCPNGNVTTRTWTISDGHGNSTTYVQLITVVDNVAPTVSTAAGSLDRTVQCNDATGLSNALALIPSATDNCGAVNMTLSGDVTTPSMSCANASTRVRTWSITDACGNAAAPFVQTIHVIDTQAPVATAGTIAASYADIASAEAAAIAATSANDNCTATGALILSASTSGTCDLVITVTANDGCGNVSNAVTYNTSITDVTAPTAVCAGGPITLTLTGGTATLTTAQVDGGSTDDCGMVTLSLSQNAFTCADIGTHTVTLTVTDEANNSSSCTTSVIVVDTDSDGDSTSDCFDLCPNDPLKTVPGVCGCGTPDVSATWYADADGDGSGDPSSTLPGYTCLPTPTGYVLVGGDLCDNDPQKLVPGACGCGTADVATTWYADTDGDGVGDASNSQAGFTCIQPLGHVAISGDLCDNDPLKLVPGLCGCGVPEGTCGGADFDAAVTAILEPTSMVCSTQLVPVVTLTNQGAQPLVSAVISYSIDGGMASTFTWTGGPLVPLASINVTLPAVTTAPGSHLLMVSSSLPNGVTDQVPDNDATTSTYNSDGETVTVRIRTDANGGQLTWAIQDDFGFNVATGGPYTGQSNTVIDTDVCLPTTFGNCYAFHLYDSFGDGLCCANGNGYWELISVSGGLLLRDNFASTPDGFESPATPPVHPSYNAGHSFCLPQGPTSIALANCGVFNYSRSARIDCNTVPGITDYQFEFTDPDAGFRRRISQPAPFVRLNQMVTSPLVPGTVYFVRVRPDQGLPGFADDHFGAGCEIAMSTNVNCPSLIDNTALTTHSCGVTRRFGSSDKVWAQPVAGATSYRFRFTHAASGYVRFISQSTYVCPLNWVTAPLQNGLTYEVAVEVTVDGIPTGFCGALCSVTINNTVGAPAMRPAAEVELSDLSYWPNPNRGDRLNLRLDDVAPEVTTVTVDIYSLAGNKVSSAVLPVNDGLLNTVIDLDDRYESGAYLLQVIAGDRSITKRLLIQR
ncbi:MAG TPA: HYR domain-containing protein [Flavobacteriales bacterium]